MIHPTTLEFLAELKDNNQRDWFNDNRKRYEASKQDVARLVNEVITTIAHFDDDLQGLEAKQSMFRIFKDVRFSKDKLPYKTNMGAWMAKGGRKSPNAGYYLHLEPGDKSFLAGGSYMPPSPILKSIREAIDYEPETLRAIIAHKDFQKHFKELDGAKLKTAPKGYPKDHPHIDLLRFKSLTVINHLTDAQVTSKSFLNEAAVIFQAMHPLIQFLNKAIAEVEQ